MLDLRVTDLIRLCRQPGCPLCAARRQAEQRYIKGLLGEGLNDGYFRATLKRSLGFCPEHTWALQATEDTHWHDGLATAGVYHELVCDVLAALRPTASDGPSTFWLRLRRWLRWFWPAIPATGAVEPLTASQPCPACQIGQGAEKRVISIFLESYRQAAVQTAYRDSAGFCLPHLRQVLGRANQKVTAFLLDVTAAKLDQLATDLAEYQRKHAWRFRNEPKVEREELAWIRAVAFFAGEAVEAEEEPVSQHRRQALEIFQVENTEPDEVLQPLTEEQVRQAR